MLEDHPANPMHSKVALASTMIGTPVYMSPEMYRGKPYGFEADIWGLGCVLYEVLHGRYAFEADSLQGLALKIMKGRHGPVTCSEGLRELIVSMLCDRPEGRPALQAILARSIVRSRIALTLAGVCSCIESHIGSRMAQEAYKTLLAQLGYMGLRWVVEPAPERCLPRVTTQGAGEDFPEVGGKRLKNLQGELRVSPRATWRAHPGGCSGAHEPVPHRSNREVAGQGVTDLTYLLQYDHISKENLACPFEPVRQLVKNSPQGRSLGPPPPSFPIVTEPTKSPPLLHDLSLVNQASTSATRYDDSTSLKASASSIDAMNLERAKAGGTVGRRWGHEALPMLPRSQFRSASVDPLPSDPVMNLDEAARRDEDQHRWRDSSLRKMHRRPMTLWQQERESSRHQFSLSYDESPADFITGGMARPRNEFGSSRARGAKGV